LQGYSESDTKQSSITEKAKLLIKKEVIFKRLKDHEANARAVIIDNSVQPEIDAPFVHEITYIILQALH